MAVLPSIFSLDTTQASETIWCLQCDVHHIVMLALFQAPVSVQLFLWLCLQPHQRRFCLCSQRWRPNTGPDADSWWSCRFQTCPASRWTGPDEWWAGCGTPTEQRSRYEEPSPRAGSLWTCASPTGGGTEEKAGRRSSMGGAEKKGQTHKEWWTY